MPTAGPEPPAAARARLYPAVIAALMDRRGMAAKDVAERAFISASLVRGIVAGSRPSVNAATAIAIAQALRVPPHAIADPIVRRGAYAQQTRESA